MAVYCDPDPDRFDNLLGRRLFLVSKRGFCYEGLIDHVNRDEAQLHLSQVLCLGLERRLRITRVHKEESIVDRLRISRGEVGWMRLVEEGEDDREEEAKEDEVNFVNDSGFDSTESERCTPTKEEVIKDKKEHSKKRRQ